MAKQFGGSKFKSILMIQAGILAILVFSFGAVALAQSGNFIAPISSSDPAETPGMLITPSPTPSVREKGSSSENPIDTPTQNPAGGNPQMDAKYKKLQDEMAQCSAALEAINSRMRALLEVSNSFYDQLTNFENTPLDPNATFEENQAVRASDDARRQAIQAQLDSASAAVTAFEATTPMASGHGMGCWQGSGPYPK